jgi:hypothetical protein
MTQLSLGQSGKDIILSYKSSQNICLLPIIWAFFVSTVVLLLAMVRAG